MDKILAISAAPSFPLRGHSDDHLVVESRWQQLHWEMSGAPINHDFPVARSCEEAYLSCFIGHQQDIQPTLRRKRRVQLPHINLQGAQQAPHIHSAAPHMN